MADRTVRAIFEAVVTGAQKGMRDLASDVDKTGKKVDGLTKDLKAVADIKAKPKIDLAIEDAQRRLTAVTKELGELRQRSSEVVRIILDVAAGLHAAHLATDEAGRHLGLEVAPLEGTVRSDDVDDSLDLVGPVECDAFATAVDVLHVAEPCVRGDPGGPQRCEAGEHLLHDRVGSRRWSRGEPGRRDRRPLGVEGLGEQRAGVAELVG